nr:metal-dependent hydrolase [uncultured Holophaga sp.]
MPSIFGHAVAGYAIGTAFSPDRPGRRTRILAVICAMAPDLDWFTGFLDPEDHLGLSHRGFPHSLLAAGLITLLAMVLGRRNQLRHLKTWLCLGTATFSHGLLDAFTFGGTGVAFLAPFSKARFVAAWQPIFVSPIPLSGGLRDWLFFSLGTELLFIGGPALVIILLARRLARTRQQRSTSTPDLSAEMPD